MEAAAPEFGTSLSHVSMFLLLKAFSSGCSALTGVEAVSNAIPNFKQPAEKNAAGTLLLMGCILGAMFIGITLLAYGYGVKPDPKATVISQIAEATFGRGTMYFIIQGVTALILFLAANTAYSAFPLLSFMMAKDKYMPHAFMVRGDRLGFSNGIIFLSVMSALLVVGFKGNTESLIPLYAVGVFIPFTLSQLGMMIRWIKVKPSGWQMKLLVNTVGMLTTLSITLIFIFTKFTQTWVIFIFCRSLFMCSCVFTVIIATSPMSYVLIFRSISQPKRQYDSHSCCGHYPGRYEYDQLRPDDVGSCGRAVHWLR